MNSENPSEKSAEDIILPGDIVRVKINAPYPRQCGELGVVLELADSYYAPDQILYWVAMKKSGCYFFLDKHLEKIV